MTAINPINVNTQGIGNSYGYEKQAKAKEKEAKEEEVSIGNQQKSVPADQVLNYMAQSAVAVTPAKKALDPSKYVDEESAARIAGFMAQFEDKVAEGLAAFNEEFAGVDISDSSKMALVLAGINKEI